MYIRFNRPNATFQSLVMKPVYPEQYIFDKKEIYAMTWTSNKIAFINHLAKEWGGKITKYAKD